MNTVRSYATAINNVGQVAIHDCSANHEFIDQLALDALASADQSDDLIITQRKRECREVASPQGGEWIDLHSIPNKCHCKLYVVVIIHSFFSVCCDAFQ